VHLATSVGCVLYGIVSWTYLGKQRERETKGTAVINIKKPTKYKILVHKNYVKLRSTLIICSIVCCCNIN